MAKPKLNTDGPWDFFLSHKQSDTNNAVALIEGDLRERSYKCWLDVKVKDCSPPAMMEGVECSRVFVLVLSKHYFESEFCIKEVLKAIELRKKIVLCHQEGLHVGDALKMMDKALKGKAPSKKAVEDIKNCTSIQLVMSDATFAKVTVEKMLDAAGFQPLNASNNLKPSSVAPQAPQVMQRDGKRIYTTEDLAGTWQISGFLTGAPCFGCTETISPKGPDKCSDGGCDTYARKGGGNTFEDDCGNTFVFDSPDHATVGGCGCGDATRVKPSQQKV